MRKEARKRGKERGCRESRVSDALEPKRPQDWEAEVKAFGVMNIKEIYGHSIGSLQENAEVAQKGCRDLRRECIKP